MRVLVTYKVAQVCLAFGQRVQKSVFECALTETQLEQFEQRLMRCINEEEDSLRVYRLREPREQYLRTYGLTRDIDFDAPLVV